MERDLLYRLQDLSYGHEIDVNGPKPAINASELMRQTRANPSTPEWELFYRIQYGNEENGVTFIKRLTRDGHVTVLTQIGNELKKTEHTFENGERYLGEGYLEIETPQNYRPYVTDVMLMRSDPQGNLSKGGRMDLRDTFNTWLSQIEPAADLSLELQAQTEPAEVSPEISATVEAETPPTAEPTASEPEAEPVAAASEPEEASEPQVEAEEDGEAEPETQETISDEELERRIRAIVVAEMAARQTEPQPGAEEAPSVITPIASEPVVAEAHVNNSSDEEVEMSSGVGTPGDQRPQPGDPQNEWHGSAWAGNEPETPISIEAEADGPEIETDPLREAPTVTPRANVEVITDETGETPAHSARVVGDERSGESDISSEAERAEDSERVPAAAAVAVAERARVQPSDNGHTTAVTAGNGLVGKNGSEGNGHLVFPESALDGSVIVRSNGNGNGRHLESAIWPELIVTNEQLTLDSVEGSEAVGPIAERIDVIDLSEKEPKKILEIKPDSDEEYHLGGNEKRIFGFAERKKARSKAEDEDIIDVDQDIVGVTPDRAGFFILDGYRKNKGGRKAAEIAAMVIAQKLEELPIRSKMSIAQYQEKLRQILIDASNTVRDSRTLYADFAEMRTTAAISKIVMKGNRSYVVSASVGDSRISVARTPKTEGDKGLNALTTDSDQLLGDEEINPISGEPWVLNKRDRTYYYTNGVHRHFADDELLAIASGKQIKRRKGGIRSLLESPFEKLADSDDDATLLISTYD